MNVLLDENLPVDLRHLLPGHVVTTVDYLGWKGIENGALVAQAAAKSFDVVVTMDDGISYERNLADLPVAVIVLRAGSNAIDDLRPLIPELLRALDTIAPRTLVRIGG